MVARCVQYVKPVRLAADPVDLAVEVLDGRRVLILELVVQEPGDYRRLAYFSRTKDH